MMELATTLAAVLGAALVLGYAALRLRLSPIVGYLVAGVCVGPFTPGFVAHGELAHELADVGVVLLMFGVGLQFHPRELVAMRRVVVPGALGQIVATSALGAGVATIAGLPAAAAALLGVSVSMSSTVIAVRTLADHDALQAATGRTALGWLVVEDVFAVIVLVIAPVAASGGRDAAGIALAGGRAVLELAALAAFVLVAGKRIVPAVLARVARTRSRELFTLTVLVVALGIAVVASRAVGASLALGAFLAGLVVGSSTFAARAGADALPFRDAFAVVFFVSIGMLLDPGALATNVPLALAIVAVVVVGKPVFAVLVLRLARLPARTALPVAASLAQIGEFSFLVTSLGRDLGMLPPAATQAVVVGAMISAVTSPIAFRLVSRFVPRVEAPAGVAPREPRAIVVGYGPVGRTLTRVLASQEIATTVVELNHDTVLALEARGQPALHGDATQPAILEAAGIASCDTLVFAASGAADAVVDAAKRANPAIRILARCTYATEVPRARAAGADTVVAAEVEVALAMSEHLLVALGASAEQLDHVRDRIRGDISGAPASSRGPASP